MNSPVGKPCHNDEERPSRIKVSTVSHAPQMPCEMRVKEANARDSRDAGSIPGSGRSPGGRHGNPLPFLAWRIPWIVEPGRLRPIGSQRVGHN